MLDRGERAERLGDFFAMQLFFARHMALRTNIPLRAAMVKFTNFHRRFGLGDPDRGISPMWESYIGTLEGLQNNKDRVTWTQEFFKTVPEETLPPHQRFFGCFGCEAPNDHGIVRIHFVNRDNDDVGPLHRSKVSLRKRDLAAMVAFLSESYPTAETVVGMSWLYHLDAYRRLFPVVYGASATPAERVRLSGTSSWGQFLRHDGTIKHALQEAFLNNFASMDVTAPWRSFPLPVLVVSAPIATFRSFYEIQTETRMR